MGIGSECDDAFAVQLIHRTLDGLSREPHVPGEVCDWLRRSGERHGADHLPAGAREANIFGEAVAGSQQAPIQLEDLEDELCSSVTGRSMARPHLSHRRDIRNGDRTLTAARSPSKSEEPL
jgi:hypothetical protein